MGEEVGTMQFRVQMGANKKLLRKKEKNEYKEKEKSICMIKRKKRDLLAVTRHPRFTTRVAGCHHAKIISLFPLQQLME
jgi:hypothetical protein